MTSFNPNHREFRCAAPKTMGAAAIRFSRVTMAALMAGTVLGTGAAVGAEITDLGALGGGLGNSVARAVSANGSTVVGSSTTSTPNWDSRAFRWTTADGMTSLGLLNGGNWSSASSVSADGSVIVGTAGIDLNRNFSRAFRWTAAAGMENLGVINGWTSSSAEGVSADGSTVVGYGVGGNLTRAFRWTAAGGMEDLGTLNSGTASSATGVSADGSVVVGWSNDGNVGNRGRAFRWTAQGGMQSLGEVLGTSMGNTSVPLDSGAEAVNSDGSVVVGWLAEPYSISGWSHAMRWTAAEGMKDIGRLTGDRNAMAYATNYDGSVVVGSSYYDYMTSRAFRWTKSTGMISVDQWLRDNGVTLPNDQTMQGSGVSADGNVVVGQLQNYRAFIARGPAPVSSPAGGGTTTTTAGLMDVTNFQQSLAASPRVSGQVQNADGVMNGAHSSPLFMLLDAGQSSAWFTGDGGYANGASYRGGLGAGEFGFGRGLDGGWTVRIAGGGQYARMDTPNAGNSVFSSGYVAPDVSYAAGSGVVATLSGYFNWGKADIRRGYLNGAANDSSFGSTATQTYGVRARVDWQDAFKLASTGISPFASYTYLNSQMNGYTETGGSFPVRFDGSREISNTVRIGADAKTPLNDNFDLVTRLEYGHRFEKAGAGVSGQILGLSAFSLEGAGVQQDFVRGGIGVSYKLGNGDGLIMVNSSNQTGKNTTWVSASYRVKF